MWWLGGSPWCSSMEGLYFMAKQPISWLIDSAMIQQKTKVNQIWEASKDRILSFLSDDKWWYKRSWWCCRCWWWGVGGWWNWPCRSKRMAVISLMTSLFHLPSKLFTSSSSPIQAKLPHPSQTSLFPHSSPKLFPPSLPQHFRPPHYFIFASFTRWNLCLKTPNLQSTLVKSFIVSTESDSAVSNHNQKNPGFFGNQISYRIKPATFKTLKPDKYKITIVAI